MVYGAPKKQRKFLADKKHYILLSNANRLRLLSLQNKKESPDVVFRRLYNFYIENGGENK